MTTAKRKLTPDASEGLHDTDSVRRWSIDPICPDAMSSYSQEAERTNRHTIEVLEERKPVCKKKTRREPSGGESRRTLCREKSQVEACVESSILGRQESKSKGCGRGSVPVSASTAG
jgi:hypothetical protein